MAKIIYSWAKGAQFNVDPQAAGERVEFLKSKHGRVNAKHIVDDARDKQSPLHAAMEWDNNKAADKYRLNQASKLLRSLVIEFETVKQPGKREKMRAFVVVKKSDEETERGYVDISMAMNDPKMRAETVNQAKREFEQLREKYRKFKELATFVKSLGEEW